MEILRSGTMGPRLREYEVRSALQSRFRSVREAGGLENS
jgi:hypothetical protein